jgi:hypothetical protein
LEIPLGGAVRTTRPEPGAPTSPARQEPGIRFVLLKEGVHQGKAVHLFGKLKLVARKLKLEGQNAGFGCFKEIFLWSKVKALSIKDSFGLPK